MGYVVMFAAKRDEVVRIVRSSSAPALDVMDVQTA
jgi:hypothetical protein